MISPASFALAYSLDWLVGDPSWLPRLVSLIESWLKRNELGVEE